MSRSARQRDAERDEFVALLDRAQEQSRTIYFWWRDDDAVTATPALERLLALSRRFSLPLGLAVIPEHASPDLSTLVADQPAVRVLQHGWSHRRHSPEGEKKMELGDHRPLAAILDELRRGREILTEVVPRSFLPILVPPWNRIGEQVQALFPQAGLVGLSMFGGESSGAPHRVNTHIDIIDWTSCRTASPSRLYSLLAIELRRRLEGDGEPVGILTHHLVHDDASWVFLEEIFAIAAAHPAVRWPSVEGLFALGGDAISRTGPKNPRP